MTEAPGACLQLGDFSGRRVVAFGVGTFRMHREDIVIGVIVTRQDSAGVLAQQVSAESVSDLHILQTQHCCYWVLRRD
jgi:hypothetical protein